MKKRELHREIHRELEADDLTQAKLVVAESKAVKTPQKLNLAVERVKTGASIDIDIHKFEEQKKEAQHSFDMATERAEKLLAAGVIDESITQAKLELSRHHHEVREQYTIIIQMLGEEKGKLGSITTAEVMVQAKRDTAEMSKRVKKAGAADFKKSMAVFRKLIDSLERNSKMQKQQVEEKASVPAVPLFTIVTTMFSEARDNVTCSIFEVKSGLRVGIFTPHINTDPGREILKMPRSKSLVKTMTNHLKQKPSVTIRLAPGYQKKVKKQILKGYDGLLFQTLPLPEQDWAALVFELQFFGYGEQGLTVNYPPFCAMESRLLLQGSEIVIGLQPATVPGEDLEAKRANLFQMPMDQVQALACMSGNWAAHHDSTEVLTIPTGFLCIYVSTGCLGYRWACSGDTADNLRIMESLRSLMSSLPEMNNVSAGHTQWKDWLGSLQTM